jgi:6-phosphogluconolactonase
VQSFICVSAQAASEACPGKVIELLGGAFERQRRASLAVSGGPTPQMMFAEYKPAKENFIDPAEFPATEAAKLDEADVREFFQLSAGVAPQLDIIHRSMGSVAHLGAVFTLLPAVQGGARPTRMLAAGDDKAEPLKAVLKDRYDSKKYPPQISACDSAGAVWFSDKAPTGLMGRGVV